MRWLIVGPYPPGVGDGPAITLAAARERLRGGDDVTVLAPVPSAADLHAPLDGLGGIRTMHRQLDGHDGLWLRVEGSIARTIGASRAVATAELVALAALLRRSGDAVVDVDDASSLPGGRVGRFLLRSGARFVVDDDAARDLLVQRGARSASVETRAAIAGPVLDADDLVWSTRVRLADAPTPPAEGSRDALEEWIRARGGEQGTRDDLDLGPLRAIVPLQLAEPPRGAKRGVALVVARLVRWMVEPVVQQVNRLHAATIEVLERDGQD